MFQLGKVENLRKILAKKLVNNSVGFILIWYIHAIWQFLFCICTLKLSPVPFKKSSNLVEKKEKQQHGWTKLYSVTVYDCSNHRKDPIITSDRRRHDWLLEGRNKNKNKILG